jgi:predicted nucleic acid-binding Zn ribbon protein
MPTYTYETIPQQPGEAPVRFELRQSMLDQPLARHPDTGAPVRRVITGGLGIIGSSRGNAPAPHKHTPGGGCCSGFR